MGVAGAAGTTVLLWSLAALRAGVAHAVVWPNALEEFEHGGLPGLLETRKEAVHRDFRRYYRVVALELLLVHHGDRSCESSRGDDQGNLDTTRRAVEAFQRRNNLPVGASQLGSQFWSNLVVPVRPGESGSAVLALKWLVAATSRPARPPLWDAAAVELHRCDASFNTALMAELSEAPASVAACVSNATELDSVGFQQDCWRALLYEPEVGIAKACEVRAPIANFFGAMWVGIWIVIAASFAISHMDGKGAGTWDCNTPGALQRVVLCGRRSLPLLAMTVCHHLAAIGIWSFPHDLVKLLLMALLITGAAMVAVHLAAVRNRAAGLVKTVLVVLLFTLGNVGACFVVLVLPHARGVWLPALLAILMAFWGCVTTILTSQNRAIRGVLLFVMCFFAAAVPTLISVVSALVNRTFIWLSAFAPTGLLAISLVSERLLGHFIVMHCEYTAETQWLFAIMFRLCIEFVRFNTALTVLLLSLVADTGLWFLLLHLAQTLVYEAAMRMPRHLTATAAGTPPKAAPSELDAPFTAAEIVLRAGAHPWVYRSRAVMFPIEVVLFVSHLCQLVFLGMPAGVNEGVWIAGLALICLELVCHEAIGHLLDRCSNSAMPRMPWTQLSGHLFALMAGAGAAMSTFAQMSSLWLMYAHHWAACFLDGGLSANDIATASEVHSATRIAATVVIGVFALAIVTHGFLCWWGWLAKVEKRLRSGQQTTMQPPSKLTVVVPLEEENDTIVPELKAASEQSLDGGKPSNRSLGTDKSPQAALVAQDTRLLEESLKSNIMSNVLLDHCSEQSSAWDLNMSGTWKNTLNSLWDDDHPRHHDNGGGHGGGGSGGWGPGGQGGGPGGPDGSGGQGQLLREPEAGEASPAQGSQLAAGGDSTDDDLQDSLGHTPAMPVDMHRILSDGLLKELGTDKDRSPMFNQELARASPSSEDCSKLLLEVLAEMPVTTHEADSVPTARALAGSEPTVAPTPEPAPVPPTPETAPAPPAGPAPTAAEGADPEDLSELEAMLRAGSCRQISNGVPMALASNEVDVPGLPPDLSKDEVQVFLSRTLTRDDLNEIMDKFEGEEGAEEDRTDTPSAAESERSTANATVAPAASSTGAKTSEVAAPAEEDAADKAAAAARTAAEEEAAARRAAEEEARRTEEEARERQRAEQAARAEAERAAAQEALAAAAQARRREALEQRLEEARAKGVAREHLDQATLVLADIIQEEALAKAAAEAEAARLAAQAAAQEALQTAIRQRWRPGLEERLAEAQARGVPEERLAEAQRVVEELLEEERRVAEEAAARAAREAARKQAAEALETAVQRRSSFVLSEGIAAAKAHGVDEAAIAQAERLLKELQEEERREAAAAALASACEEEDLDEIRSKLEQAREAGVAGERLTEAAARVQELVRRDTARKQVQDACAPWPAEPVADHMARLRDAMQRASAAGVSAAEMQAPGELLAELEAQSRREEAASAMVEALAAQDIERTREALASARSVGVEEAEIAKVESGLRDLEEELELAHDKESLLLRKIENAMAAKNAAEHATASKEVENMLGEGSVTKALRNVIDEAKKMRLVGRSEIQKAEAVLNEVTADLKRILVAKQQQEQKKAEEELADEMETARLTAVTTRPVLEKLTKAILAARAFSANTQSAEALLGSLTAAHERERQAAHEGLSRAVEAQDAAAIKSGIDRCRSLLLADTVSNAMRQCRGIISSELDAAREAEREERLRKLPNIEALIGVLRAVGDTQLRQFHNDLQDLKGALRVFCRVRPLNKREKGLGDTVGVEIVDPFTVSVQASTGDPQHFSYDAIFGPTSSQAEVFSECRSLVQSAFDGYNVTIFSYGQTGAGKTWTLYGTGDEPGISPRTCDEVFRMVARDSDRLDFELKASMVELYLNDLRDLLSRAKEPAKLEFRSVKQADGSIGVRLEGATEMRVSSSEDLAQVVMAGLSQRKVKKTNMNADSSRSHLLLVISVGVTDRASGRSRRGKITIVDLAGSERLAKSGVTGEGQREAIEINKSLTALGDVMMAFTSRSKVIPYRNHKLTQLMQDSLGGSAKTLMFVNISPATTNADETTNALKYASRARCIENDVKKHK